jgi:hypothetical protein
MKYTKEDLLQLESLISQLNELLKSKFNCSVIDVKRLNRAEIRLQIYEPVSSNSSFV